MQTTNMFYTSLERSFNSTLLVFVAQKLMQKWLRNGQIKIEGFLIIFTGALFL